MKHILFLILFILSFVVTIGFNAEADDNRYEVIEDPIELGEHVYEKTTYQNLTNYFVNSGAIDLRIPEVMVDYARIFQCEVYQDYYEDEHEWQQISKAIATSAMKKIDKTLTRSQRRKGYFYFTSNLRLERFDPTVNGFPLHPEDAMHQIQRIEVIDMRKYNLCNKNGVGAAFPTKTFLQTENHITLDTLVVPDEGAFEQISDIRVSKSNSARNITAVYFFSVYNYEDSTARECVNSRMNCLDLVGELEYISYYKTPELKDFLFIQKIEKENPESDRL